MNTNAAFLRKARSLEELINWSRIAKQRSSFVIEKTIELEQTEFEHFANDLFADQDFIKENMDHMYTDKNGVKHCILVRARGETTGILVENEGYDYPRYSAYLKG